MHCHSLFIIIFQITKTEKAKHCTEAKEPQPELVNIAVKNASQ